MGNQIGRLGGSFMHRTIIFGIGFDNLRHITQTFVGIVTGIWIGEVVDPIAGYVIRFQRSGDRRQGIVTFFCLDLELLLQDLIQLRIS